MAGICKTTLNEVKQNYEERVGKYINTLYGKSFEEITDPMNPLHKVNGIKFLNVKKDNISPTTFSIEINREGLNKLIIKETFRIVNEDVDETFDPTLPPDDFELPEGMMPEGVPNMPGVLPPGMVPTAKPDYPYRFEETLAHRRQLKDSIDRKIQLLQNEELAEETSKQQLEQIAYLKDISVKLFKEIQFLEKNEGDVDAFVDNIATDIKNTMGLLKNPTIENLEFARKYLQMLDYFVRDDETGFLKSSYSTLKDTNPDIHNKIVQARQGITEAKDDLAAKVNLQVEEKIKYHIRQKEEYQNADEAFLESEAKRLFKEQFAEQQEIWYGLKFYTKMEDMEEEGNVLVSVIKKAYDDAVRNNGKKGVEDKLLAKEKSIVNRLIETGNYVGSFFKKKALWDVFKTDNEGENRLINPFTVSWQKFKKANEVKQRVISKIFYNFSAESSDTQLAAIDKHYETLKKEADFIDIRKLPEIIANKDFDEFKGSFSTDAEALAYRDEIIARIGRREYNKLIKEAEDNINSFMIEKEVKFNQLKDEYGVTNGQELQNAMYRAGAESVWNFYLQNYYTKSPFIFAENHFDQATGNKIAKVYFVENKQYLNYDARANLEYSTFIPKTKYHDSKFEEKIKGDKVLLEAWELMDELVEYSNKNGADYNADTDLDTDLGHERKRTHLLTDVLGLLSPTALTNLKKIMRRLTSTISGEGWVDETAEDKRIAGQRVTTEKKIMQQFNKLIAIDGLKQVNMTEAQIEEYRERALNLVNKHADTENLLHNIITSSQMTGSFKAKKEVETYLQFIANQLRGAKGRKAFTEIVDFFINRNLYAINNRGKTAKGKFRNEFGRRVKHYPHEHEEIRKEIKEGLKVLKKRAKKEPNNKELALQIADLEKMYEDGVVYVNGRDVTEAMLFKVKAFTAFAINGSAQVTNMAIASANAYEVDGRPGFWKAGIYTRSMSFARKYKNIKLITSKKMREQRKIMDLFLKSADLVQNSANEIYREQSSRFGSAVKEVIKNPTNFVGEVEKTIQKPQLLALLTEVFVEDKNGQKVPVFDVKKGEFPAFTLKDGVLVLKKDFDTKKNRDTFISFNSQEAANIFGESGKIPKAIAYINGDYRNSTTYLAEKYIVTAMTLMFKRWAIATIYKKADIYKRLAKNDQHIAGNGFQLLKAGIFATAVGSAGLLGGVFTMPVVMGIGIGWYAISQRKAFLKQIQEDQTKLEQIYKNTKEVQLAVSMEKYVKGSLTIATLALSTAAQALLNIPSRWIGRDVIDSDKLKSMVYIDKKNLQQKAVDEIQADLYFLQTSTALVLRNMIYGVMLHSLYSLLDPGFDDDEEKEAYKKAVEAEKGIYFAGEDERTKIQTVMEYPGLSTYYALNNMLASFAEDMSLTENWTGLQRMGQAGSIEDAWNVGEELVKDEEYERGKNAGRKKGVVLAERYVTPSAVNLFGFGNKMEKDYNTEGIVDRSNKTNLEIMTDIHKEAKKVAKKNHEEVVKTWAEYETLPEGERADWVKKELTKFSRNEYPSLKPEDFNKDGSLTAEGMDKVRNYRAGIPEDLLKELKLE